MRRTQTILLAVVGLLALVVLVLIWRNRHPPPLPRDTDHVYVHVERCLSCHGPGTEHPRGPNHPPARECMRCHGP